MTEHKTDIYIQKIEHDGAQNSHEHIKIDKYKKTEQQFYDGTQNRYEHY